MQPAPPRSAPRADDGAVEKVYDAVAPLVGERHARRDEETRLRYATDESGAGAFPPQLVVLPGSTEEVSAVLAACARHGVPVVPRGGGTGRAGGALAVQGGVVLGLERMNRLQAIHEASLTATAQPGIVLRDLQTAVEERGLFYPPDPNSLESCHLGGNVSTNAGGPRAVKYGVTRDYVRALEVVLVGGEVLKVGRPTLKGVAGYDLTALMVGSEGTLGVITEVTVRLKPRPERVETALLFFPSASHASRAALAIFQAGHLPRTMELLDHAAIDAVRPRAPFRFPEDAGSAILLELDGAGDEVFEELVRIAELCEARYETSLVLVAKSESERADLWASRRIMSEALKHKTGRKYAEDIAVPLEHIPRTIDAVHAIAERHGLSAALYGHMGDGNLHVNLLFHEEGEWPEVMRAAEEVFREAVAVGGTITGEHGVGLVKRGYLGLEQSAPLIGLQRRLKRTFDPDDLLNPGKVLPAP